MKPQKDVEAEELANSQMRKQRQQTCKASNFSVKEGDKDYEKQTFDYSIENTGCTNPRRNGSAWCQSCSDKHHLATT